MIRRAGGRNERACGGAVSGTFDPAEHDARPGWLITEEPMLILGRKVDQAILIGEGDQQIRVLVVRIRGDEVRIGIDAPKEVPIVREELEEPK
jgi:carbon storage regulator CsrA